MKDYIEKRNALMEEARAALVAGEIALAQEKREAVEALDQEKTKYDREAASLNALLSMEVGAPVALEDGSVAPVGARTAETLEGAMTPVDREVEAFRAYLIGQPYDASALRRGEMSNSANTAASNAVVIPERVRDMIWTEMADRHPVLRALRMTFVNGDLAIIKEASGGDDAAWYEEADTVADGALSFAKVELKGYELAKAVPVTWTLKKMSMDAFLPYVVSLIAKKMGNALAAAVIAGKGVPGDLDEWKAQPQGITTALEAEGSTPQVVTWTPSSDEITYAKLCSVMSKIKSGYLSGAGIYATNDFIWNYLANVKDSTNRPYFIPDPTSGGVGRMFGLTVYEEDAAPANGAIFGNIAEGYVANCNENVTMYQEDHVKTRITDYMGYALVDGKVLTTKAFVYLKKSA